MRLDGFGIFVKDMPVMVRFYRDDTPPNPPSPANAPRRHQSPISRARRFCPAYPPVAALKACP